MEHAIIPPCFYRISVKAIIHNDEGKFLLVKEENWLWQLPWWWVDYGENLQECLKREIREEMGLEVTFIADVPSYFYTSTNLKWWNIANALYETKVRNFEFMPSKECIEIWFFTFEEAKTLKTWPNIQEFLKHYRPENHLHA